jgi:hypothetical protein
MLLLLVASVMARVELCVVMENLAFERFNSIPNRLECIFLDVVEMQGERFDDHGIHRDPIIGPTVPSVNQPTRAWLCRKNFSSVTKDSGDDEEIESKLAYNSAVGWPHNENYCQRSKLSVRALIISASRRDINVMPANAHSSDHKNICGSGCGCGRTMVCRNMMKERPTDKGWNC